MSNVFRPLFILTSELRLRSLFFLGLGGLAFLEEMSYG